MVSLSSAGAVTLPKVPTFNAADFGVMADGTTDDTSAWQGGIAKLAAVGGGVLLAPIGTSVISQTLLLDSDGAKIIGQGRGAYHDVNPLAPAASTLRWAGTAGGTMVRVGPDVGSTGSGVTDWAVVGVHLLSGVFPYSTAAGTGLEIVSASHGSADVFCSEFATQGCIVHTLIGPTESANSAYNRISVRGRQINTGGVILRVTGNGTSNSCFNSFEVVAGEYGGSIGLDLGDADNNDFWLVYLQPVGTGAGPQVNFNAGAAPKSGQPNQARNNTIYRLSGDVGPLLVTALGTENGAVPSGPNRIVQLDGANASPTVEAGTGALIYWGSNTMPPGVRAQNTNQYGGYRVAEDGFACAWGTTAAPLPVGTTPIVLPAGLFRRYLTAFGATAIGTNGARVSISAPSTSSISISTDTSAIFNWWAEGY